VNHALDISQPHVATVILVRQLLVIEPKQVEDRGVSTCEGAPFVQRKITRRARPGKCGAFGESGEPFRSAAAAIDDSPANAR
jgi:hypothetical protein